MNNKKTMSLLLALILAIPVFARPRPRPRPRPIHSRPDVTRPVPHTPTNPNPPVIHNPNVPHLGTGDPGPVIAQVKPRDTIDYQHRVTITENGAVVMNTFLMGDTSERRYEHASDVQLLESLRNGNEGPWVVAGSHGPSLDPIFLNNIQQAVLETGASHVFLDVCYGQQMANEISQACSELAGREIPVLAVFGEIEFVKDENGKLYIHIMSREGETLPLNHSIVLAYPDRSELVDPDTFFKLNPDFGLIKNLATGSTLQPDNW